MLKILQISDSHILPEPGNTLLGIDTEYYFRQVLKQAFALHKRFDLILVSGDLAQTPSLAVYQRILQHLTAYRTPALCLPGNHDDFAMMQATFHDELFNCRKHVLLGGWQIVCLNSQKINSPVGKLNDAELSFLEQRLFQQPDTPTIIALHHPSFETGSQWLDTMQLVNSDGFLDLLDRHSQVKAVTCGHIHQEMEVSHGGFSLYAAPATCFEFQRLSQEFCVEDTPPGYRVFELSPDGGVQSACYYLDEPLRGLDQTANGY